MDKFDVPYAVLIAPNKHSSSNSDIHHMNFGGRIKRSLLCPNKLLIIRLTIIRVKKKVISLITGRSNDWRMTSGNKGETTNSAIANVGLVTAMPIRTTASRKNNGMSGMIISNTI